jgi:hypothetical protein
VFTARYGLRLSIKQSAHRLYEVNMTSRNKTSLNAVIIIVFVYGILKCNICCALH